MLSLPLAGIPGLERRLLLNVTCPNCWHRFPPGDALWISTHGRLRGDSVLTGGNEQRRFPPTRFTPNGKAIDAEGGECTQLACPRCHLLVPRATLELEPSILSVIGLSGSGKSVMLTAAIRQLKNAGEEFGCTVADADLTLNKLLLEEEARMFDEAGAGGYRPIEDVVKKTRVVDADRYREVRMEGRVVKYVPPYCYMVTPRQEHPRHGSKKPVGRLLCLYDNAGEHFMPGADSAEMPATRHLAQSKGLVYTFDPTQHRGIAERIGLGAGGVATANQQHQLLPEAAHRIRSHGNQAWTAQLSQPLVVAVTKHDAWGSLAPAFDHAKLFRTYPGSTVKALHVDRLLAASQELRKFLREHCNDVVQAAESSFKEVVYIPVAAAGTDVRRGAGAGAKPMFRPAPTGYSACLPFIFLLNRDAGSLVLAVRSDDAGRSGSNPSVRLGGR